MKLFGRTCLVFLLLFCGAAHAQSVLPNFSGMAQMGPGLYLVVADLKSNAQGDRVGVLRWSDGNYRVEPVSVDWGDAKVGSDLEGCCPVPGRPGEFFLVESGYYRGNFGRVLQLKLEHDPLKGWTARVLSSFQPYALPAGIDTTTGPQQVEGIASFPGPSGNPVIVLGKRGDEKTPGELEWGILEADGFRPLGVQVLDLRPALGDRSCADLMLIADGQEWRVFSVATSDPGDVGAFASAVFEVGRFRVKEFDVRFIPLPKPILAARIDGFKAEALAPPPPEFADAKFCVGTDDEKFNPVWRVLRVGK